MFPLTERRDAVEAASVAISADVETHIDDRPDQGRAFEYVSLIVPRRSTSAETARYITEAALWDENQPTQNGAKIRQGLSKHIDQRTPGFGVREARSSRHQVKYYRSDEVIKLSNGDVIWRKHRYGNSRGERFHMFDDTKIGVVAENGWVRLLSGKRATLSALQKFAPDLRGSTNPQLNDTLDAVISPYHVDPNATQLGVFIGGTSMHFYGLGNVERLYNLYQGSKFYYGGVFNDIDFADNDYAAGGAGRGWDETVQRALADIKKFRADGQKIHIFGWSRGAAMANDLADHLSRQGIEVSFVGMFDPVYSRGFPGQHAYKTDGATWGGWWGNYVTTTISGNVKAAAAIYAANESRSFFPATRFRLLGDTQFLTMKSPGAHGEVGGHFESNMGMQRLNMRAMIQFASSHGGAKFTFRGIDVDVARIISSPKSREIALRPYKGEETGDPPGKWDEATLFKHWKPFTATEYHQQLHSTEPREWEPGSFGTQKGEWGARAAWYVSMQIRNLLPTRWFVPPQPMSAHYPRNLSWVEFELWDVPWQEANAKRLQVSEEAKNFIRALYEKSIDPKEGGWKK